MKIISGQKAYAAIIIPALPTKSEEFAALELQKYIKSISGASLPIYNEKEKVNGNVILIGGPERNKKTECFISLEEFKSKAPGSEGMMIKTFSDSCLVLAGSSINPNERGTLYAVYEFLERFLGCSFTAYGKLGTDIGEYIPDIPDLEIGNIEYIKGSADLSYRTAIVQFDGGEYENSDPNYGLTTSFIDWMGKNRLNRILLMAKSYEIIKTNGVLEEIQKRGISITTGHHESSMMFLPPIGNEIFPERYYETHPEYYTLLPDGSRYFAECKWQGQIIFDMRNRDCINQIAENIKLWLKDNPCVDIVNLWPNDGEQPQCTCSECSKYSKTTNYAYFVNEIAKIVNKDYPNVKIDMLVYLNIWDPPCGVEIGPGVLVDMSTWTMKDRTLILRRFGKKDGTGLIGTPFEHNALEWSRIAGGMAYYDYYMTDFGGEQKYCPMADEICSIYESFMEKGYCYGTGSQMEAYNLWNYLFNFYVHGRKSYDTSLSMEELLDRFIKIFGNGSEFIKEYIKYAEDFYEGQAPDGTGSSNYFIENVDKDKVYRLFEKAYEAQPEGRLRDNIRLLRMAFRYSDLHYNNPGCDELIYMSNEFSGFWGVLGQTGYGIAVLYKPGNTGYIPDKWYHFRN